MRHWALLLTVALVVLSGCTDADDDVSWTATFTASEGETTSTGGAVIQANSKVVVGVPVWVVDDPAPFEGDIPLPDLAALGDAIARTDWEVRDAVLTPEGTLALLVREGHTMLLLFEDGLDAAVHAPDSAQRLILAGEAPTRVLVLMEDGLAALATRVEP